MWAADLSSFCLSCPHTSPLPASTTHHRHTSCLTHWSCCFAENKRYGHPTFRTILGGWHISPNDWFVDGMLHPTTLRGWHTLPNDTSSMQHMIKCSSSLPLCKWEQRSALKLVNVVLLVTECWPLFFLMKFSATRTEFSFALPKKQREPNLQKKWCCQCTAEGWWLWQVVSWCLDFFCLFVVVF